jgi:hypothetical protein
MTIEVDRDRRIWEVERAIKEGRFMTGSPGKTAQWDKEHGARLRPWQQSLIDDRYNGKLRDPGLPQEHGFSIPVLHKRTFEERQESMIRRLIDTPEPLQEDLLKQIAGGYWKEGMPVTMAALRDAAAAILNRADVRLALSNRTAGGKTHG